MKPRNKKSQNPQENEVKRRTISAPPAMLEMADKRAKEGMYQTFSGYVQDLIRRDVGGVKA